MLQTVRCLATCDVTFAHGHSTGLQTRLPTVADFRQNRIYSLKNKSGYGRI